MTPKADLSHIACPMQANLVLASASPRRKELLSQLGVTFQVDPASTDRWTTCVPWFREVSQAGGGVVPGAPGDAGGAGAAGGAGGVSWGPPAGAEPVA